MMSKGPSVSKDKLSRGGDGELEPESEDVGVDDQIKICANKLMRAIHEENVDLFVRAYTDLHEAVDLKLEGGEGEEEESGDDYSSDSLSE